MIGRGFLQKARIGFLLVTCVSARGESIRVVLYENLPEPWAWHDRRVRPTDVFDEPALGFVQLPAKVNFRGIEIDRSSPYLLVAETSLSVPTGDYRLLLRVRGGAADCGWCRPRGDEAGQPQFRGS